MQTYRRGAAWTVACALLAMSHQAAAAGTWTVVGWNNLGMHCMDADYAVFSLLPPFNTIHAQVVDPQGKLVKDAAAAGISVTYQAIADPDGSINTTSQGKTNFWDHVQALFGTPPTPDVGLLGAAMPGATNTPRAMSFDTTAEWFIAEGIPITPYDDGQHKNSYPLMRVIAHQSGAVLAATDIVLPVSDEMDCRACHASGSSPGAPPDSGWVFDPDPQRDMRLNILRLHDDRQSLLDTYADVLSAAGYDVAGLYATATSPTNPSPILCARCHRSEALKDSGLAGVTSLTQAVHHRMAFVTDPTNGLPLEETDNRSACYRCHPGSVTRCLRGAMGAAVAADGTLAMQCQSCHGSMTTVADPNRTGWLDEPTCQNCHTGTATHNNGQIRYTSAFDDATGEPRVAVDQTFATNQGVPMPGFSLYRFSKAHGGLACEACHGSTHAEFPSSHRNDNIQSIAHQGHVGMLVECTTCHGTQPNTINGGPHGMHPVGQEWVSRHSDLIGEGSGSAAPCQSCHGADYRGTILSRSQADRTLNTEDFGTKRVWRGFQIGCYTCHNGPGGGGANPNHPAVAHDASASTATNTPASAMLTASDADGNALTFRIVSQPSHGTVGLSGTQATYFPEANFTGTDAFTFAAWDGSTDSNLATVSLTVSAPPACPGDCRNVHHVAVNDVVLMLNLALGTAGAPPCDNGDVTGDGHITIDEIFQALNSALNGC